jgi:hypothetical protein
VRGVRVEEEHVRSADLDRRDEGEHRLGERAESPPLGDGIERHDGETPARGERLRHARARADPCRARGVVAMEDATVRDHGDGAIAVRPRLSPAARALERELRDVDREDARARSVTRHGDLLPRAR